MPDWRQVAVLSVSATLVFAFGFAMGWYTVSMCVMVVIIIALSLHVYCCYNYYSMKQRTRREKVIHQLQESNKLKTWQHTFP